MFAYLLIAFEISLLSAVFWYVFVREPRPFEIKEDLWGYYATKDAHTEDGISNVMKARRARRAHPNEVLLRSSRHGVKRKIGQTDSELKNGWVVMEESKPNSSLGALLAFLGNKLTQLSVRLS